MPTNRWNSLIALVAAASSRPDAVSARYLHGNRLGPTVVVVVDERARVEEEAPPSRRTIKEDEEEEPPTTYDPAADDDNDHSGSLIASQFSADPHAGRDKLEMIRTGELGLAGLRYMPASFSDDDNTGEGDSYSDVYGEFCVYDARLNRSDPPRYPTSKHVLSDSDHCGEHRYMVPLNKAMDAIEEEGDDVNVNVNKVRTLPPSGMLFHQGYSGAGAISNVLAAFDSALVVSEHPALHDALAACDVIRNRYLSDDCSASRQRDLVRDVVTLLSRTKEESVSHLFFKLHSSSAAYLPTLVELYPSSRWTFSYRDAGETLSKTMRRKRNVACGKARRNPSSALAEKSEEDHLDLEGLSHHEVCALHLSTLLEAAMVEHERTGNGMLVSYDDVLSSSGRVVSDDVLSYLGLRSEVDSDPVLRARVTDVLSTRSNAGGNGDNGGKSMDWDESQEADIEISEEVRDAVKKFMGELMVNSSRRI